jgi:two-component system sensor kinase FixL
MPENSRTALRSVVLVFLSVSVFVLDWALPTSLTVELLQVPVILLTLFLPWRRAPWAFGSLTTFLVGLGYVIHVGAGDPFALLLNRGLVLAGLWLAVGAVLRFKQVRRARRKSEARAKAILETVADGIMTLTADGTIKSFNPAAEDIFGYSADEIVGENIDRLVAPPHRTVVEKQLRRPVPFEQTGSPGVDREMTGQCKDGSTFPMELSIHEVELDDRIVFTGMARNVSERRRLEQEILDASETERRRIGQDLHDGLGQMLTGIGLLCQDLARHLDEEGHHRADDMAEITEHVKKADRRARTLSHGLIPVDVEPNGLVEALRRLTEEVERPFDVECDFQEIGTVRVRDSTVTTHVYRIAQEAMNNATRHADPDHIKVVLASEEDDLQLRIEDDGVGFEAENPGEKGMGLRTMQYRARLIGGTLDIDSQAGEGTTVTCTLLHPSLSTDSGEESAPRPGGDTAPAE